MTGETTASRDDFELPEDLITGPPPINVGNENIAAHWLRYNLGTGLLAGMFRRAGQIVHTPREGDEGYLPLTENNDDEDGPAQVRIATADYIAARVTYTYDCFMVKKLKSGDEVEVPILFPLRSARVAVHAVDMLPGLRPLRGVVHTPVFRPDGSLLDAPGYDETTRLLYLPEPGLVVPKVPEEPSDAELEQAVSLIMLMISGFPFVSPHDRANLIGLLLTPLLRTIVPPPYKLGAIEAHQRGSGKTLLANVVRGIHGGPFRSEMPGDDTELGKQVTSILMFTTGPVVVFDNVSGTLNSSKFSGLLTSKDWDDRQLGSNNWQFCTNDRVWMITGNNLNIGGDLPRRTLRVLIDPKMPRPETRTNFKVRGLNIWVAEHRGELLAALLTIVRSWVVNGSQLGADHTSDDYAVWTRTVSGILANAGIEGTFDHADTQVVIGTDDSEWADFLAAIHRVYGEKAWTCRELLDGVDCFGEHTRNGKLGQEPPLTPDDLPTEFVKAGYSGYQTVVITPRSLGRWLANRRGRWAGEFTVREAGKSQKTKKWKIERNVTTK